MRANGLPRAVVANDAADNLTVVDVAADGSISSRTEPVDSACKNPLHAEPFAYSGKDFVAATCNASDNCVVRELTGF